MEKFRTLIDEVKAQSDKNKKFLITHGIDPKALLIPMYYPDRKCNVVLQSPSDDSPWFKDEKVSPKDKVLVRCVSEVYDQEGNFYQKERGDVIELTVDEYKDKVLDNPENDETQEDMQFTDLSSDEKINKTLSDIDIHNKETREKQKRDLQEFADWLIHIGGGDLLNSLDLPEKDNHVDLNLVPNNVMRALEKLKSLYKLGVDMNSEYANYIVWESKNHLILDAVKNKIKEIKNDDERENIAVVFKKMKKMWFRENLNQKILIPRINAWWKNLGLSPLSINVAKNESSLLEWGNSESYLLYTDAKIDQYLDSVFGENARRFKTVPIINNPYNPDDPDADPVEYLLIRGIDTSDLSDNGRVRVGKTNKFGGKVFETYVMNIGDLKEIIDRPENKDTTLDTDSYRRQAGNQFNTLNPGYGGKYVELPEEVVMEMLEEMQNDDEGDYRYDYTMVDLIGKYKEELKDPNKHSDIVLKALQDYNGYGNRQYQIRYSKSKNKYMGLLEYEGHITAPTNHSWRG